MLSSIGLLKAAHSHAPLLGAHQQDDAGQLSALKHSSVSNSALAAFGASMDLGPGVQNGLTGFMILPYKEFSFADGMPASQVSTMCAAQR